MPLYSIITPTFNRRQTIERSIDASLTFATALGDAELVVVDDASPDGTADVIKARYSAELASGRLRLLVQPVNGGVTAARNLAFRSAEGTWLILVDSDDQMIASAAPAFAKFVAAHSQAAMILCRCADETGHLIGPPCQPKPLDLASLVNQGTPGECLPVLRRDAALAQPFDEDLRGFEILAYLRIARAGGAIVLSDIVARSYGTSSANRLSSFSGRMRRADLMVRGFGRLLEQFGDVMPAQTRLAIRLRMFAYWLAWHTRAAQ